MMPQKPGHEDASEEIAIQLSLDMVALVCLLLPHTWLYVPYCSSSSLQDSNTTYPQLARFRIGRGRFRIRVCACEARKLRYLGKR